MDDVLDFLIQHENDAGEVGKFVRSCILVAERSEYMTREELKDSDQFGYLLDCFPTLAPKENDA